MDRPHIGIAPVPVLFPLGTGHLYASGSTRFGKTYVARAVAEGALIEGVNVVIFDRTLQWAGIGIPNTNEKELARFDMVGIGREYVRGFDAKIYTPGSDVGLPLPDDFGGIFNGCSVMSLKALTDKDSCTVARDVLRAIYDSYNQETDRVKLLVILEEASTFLPESVSPDANKISREVRSLITRIAREKAKYGVSLLFISQSLSDFRTDAKIVREMVSTRFFLRATDRAEHEYIGQYVSNEAVEIVKNLKQGEAFLHTPGIPGVKFFVRAPFSSVKEPSDEEIRQINRRHQMKHTPSNETIKQMFEPKLTEKESQALKIIKEYHELEGGAILASEIGRRLKIRGGSRQRMLDKLVEKNLLKKVEIKVERGRPAHAFIPNN